MPTCLQVLQEIETSSRNGIKEETRRYTLLQGRNHHRMDQHLPHSVELRLQTRHLFLAPEATNAKLSPSRLYVPSSLSNLFKINALGVVNQRLNTLNDSCQ